MREQEIGDGSGLLDRGQVRGAGDQGQPGVGYARDQGAGIAGPGDLVLGPDQDERGDTDPAQFPTDVEGGEGLAGGYVAPGVGGPDHLDGPLDDGRLRGGEPRGEPPFRGGAGHRLQPVGADDHPALPELVGAAEPRGGGNQGQRCHPVRVAQRELGPDRAGDGAARVSEALDAKAVEGGEQPGCELTDGGGRVGGRAAVAREVEAEDSPVLGELGYLPVPHVPCGTEGGADHQDRRVFRPVKAVLQGFNVLLTHPLTLPHLGCAP